MNYRGFENFLNIRNGVKDMVESVLFLNNHKVIK